MELPPPTSHLPPSNVRSLFPDHTFQGGTQFDLSELMTAEGNRLTKPLGRGKSTKTSTTFNLQGSSKMGTITVSGEVGILR